MILESTKFSYALSHVILQALGCLQHTKIDQSSCRIIQMSRLKVLGFGSHLNATTWCYFLAKKKKKLLGVRRQGSDPLQIP